MFSELNKAQVVYDVVDVATLRDIPPNPGSIACTYGVLSSGDGGGGNWRAVTGADPATYVDNLGTIVVPTGGDGSAAWIRDYSGPVNVLWFSAFGNDQSIDVTSLFQAAVDAAYDSVNDINHGSVFIPTPTDAYRVTGVNCYGRVSIKGENKWGTKIIVPGAGSYGFVAARLVTDLLFDGVSIANGAHRIDEADWTSAHRGNTAIIASNFTTGVSALGYQIVKRCLFRNLAVCIERSGCLNAKAEDCHFGAGLNENWHCIFNRAEDDGTFGYNNACRDKNLYMQYNKGHAIGFYPIKQPYIDYQIEQLVAEYCCTDPIHDGIDGYINVPNSSTNALFAINGLYMEADESAHPNAIGIKANNFTLDSFWMQSFEHHIKRLTTSTSWRLSNGSFVDSSGDYDCEPGVVGGRNRFENVAFNKGLNPAALGYTSLYDCRFSGVLPHANQNTHMDDGSFYLGTQHSTIPGLRLNKRATDGPIQQWQRQGIRAQEMAVAVVSPTPRNAGVTTAAGANRLLDSTQNFSKNVRVGNIVKNNGTGSFARVVSVDSNRQLTIDTDIFSRGDSYTVSHEPVATFTQPQAFPSITMAELVVYSPSIYEGCLLRITDESDGPTLAISDGTNWLRIRDNAVVS